MESVDFSVGTVAFAYRRTYRPHQALNMVERRHHGLTLVLSGTFHLTYANGTTATANANDVLLQRMGDSYRLEAGDAETEYIVISYLTEPADFPVRALPADAIFTPMHLHRYRDAFERAAHVYSSYSVCTEPLLRALVQEILCNIIRESYPRALSASENPAACARYYIERHFDREISAEEISRAAGCSPSHLRMLFKKEYGESPTRFLNRVRVERAKEMIVSGIFMLKEIAIACGFQNVYYFSRVFKSFTGVPPGKY
ncbi:MAG: helix-turn-helix transcriptional regulator [Clostridia bacterium]|nr:helix-turn-helix transcriptional regulator [Clostridia bacterium]